MRHDQTESPTCHEGTRREAGDPTLRRDRTATGPGRRIGTRTMAAALVMALTLALGLGACSSDGDDAGGGSGGDGGAADASGGQADGESAAASDLPTACSLLEVAEVEAEFGGPVMDGSGDDLNCRWLVGEDPQASTSGSVHVNVQDPARIPADEQYAGSKETIEDEEAVDGIGDEAYTYLDGSVIVILSGDVTYAVQSGYFPQPDGVQEKLENLARQVEERL